MRPKLVALCLPFVMACQGGGASRPQVTSQPWQASAGNWQPQPQARVPLFNPFTSAVATAARFLPADAACPPPWIPPEAARLLDCAAMKEATGALQFVPRNIVAAALPPSVDLRVAGLTGPVKSQGNVGSCAGQAISSVIDNATRRAGGRDVTSALHVFSTYIEKDDLGMVKGRAMTTEPIWPYDVRRACKLDHDPDCAAELGVAPSSWRSDPALVAERSRADASGRFTVAALERIDYDPVQLAGLLADGEAFYVALSFDRSSWESLSRGGGSILPPMPNPDQAHAVTMVGYRQGRAEREFIIQNSWGTDWGERGFAYVPESTLRGIWSNGYRVRIAGQPGVLPPVVGTTTCADGGPAILGICPGDIGRVGVPGLPQATGAIPGLDAWLKQVPVQGIPAGPACASGQLGVPGVGCVALPR